MKNKEAYTVKYLPIDALEPDPVNSEGFNIKDIDELAAYIKEDGFFGDVVAYPIGGGKYRLESGERRYWAAQRAGMNEIPVSITAPPETEVERRVRLERRNLGARKMDPMDMAKLVAFEYDTNCMKKNNGELNEPLIDATARRLHISTSQVSKYKMLNDLVPELQKLVSEKKVPWAIMAQASQLPEENQKALYKRIVQEQKLREVTGQWLQKEIREYRYLRLNGSVLNKPLYSAPSSPSISEDKKKRLRRKDGIKALEKASAILDEIASSDYFIRAINNEYANEMIDKIIENVRKMRRS